MRRIITVVIVGMTLIGKTRMAMIRKVTLKNEVSVEKCTEKNRHIESYIHNDTPFYQVAQLRVGTQKSRLQSWGPQQSHNAIVPHLFESPADSEQVKRLTSLWSHKPMCIGIFVWSGWRLRGNNDLIQLHCRSTRLRSFRFRVGELCLTCVRNCISWPKI